MYQAPHTNSSATSEMNASILNKKKKISCRKFPIMIKFLIMLRNSNLVFCQWQNKQDSTVLVRYTKIYFKRVEDEQLWGFLFCFQSVTAVGPAQSSDPSTAGLRSHKASAPLALPSNTRIFGLRSTPEIGTAETGTPSKQYSQPQLVQKGHDHHETKITNLLWKSNHIPNIK